MKEPWPQTLFPLKSPPLKPISSEQSKSQKSTFFLGGMEGWVVVLILFVIGVLEIGTYSGVSLQYQNQLKIYTIMKGQLELQFSENEVMINEKTSRRARRASKAAEEARNERDVYLVSLLVAFFITMFI